MEKRNKIILPKNITEFNDLNPHEARNIVLKLLENNDNNTSLFFSDIEGYFSNNNNRKLSLFKKIIDIFIDVSKHITGDKLECVISIVKNLNPPIEFFIDNFQNRFFLNYHDYKDVIERVIESNFNKDRFPNLILEHQKILIFIELFCKENISDDRYKSRNNNIVKLDLSNMDMNFIPNILFDIESIEDLNLSGNSISEISDGFMTFFSLQKLDLSNNCITSLSLEPLLNISSLKLLNLSYNELDTIPEDICELKELKWLNISHNNIVNIAESIDECINLEVILMNSNNLSYLPTLIHLERLKELDISNNKINELPNVFLNNKELKLKI